MVNTQYAKWLKFLGGYFGRGNIDIVFIAAAMVFIASAMAFIASAHAAPALSDADTADALNEIVVEGRGPRFVAPNRRDQIGRIWAPVMINGRGPFRLVLDSGASHSGVTANVASVLGMALDASPPVMLRGVTGFATVPTIRASSLSIGDLMLEPAILPIIPDALGGAQGILGTSGFADKRVFIDFRHDKITITYSRGESEDRDLVKIPFRTLRGQLIVVDSRVDGVRVKAIIDTGGQASIANLSLRDALRRHRTLHGRPDEIMGATKEIQSGELIATPAIEFGSININHSGVTFADMYIFTHWKFTTEPAILIGMDVLGLLDTLIIDYRRHLLYMRTRRGG